MKIKYHLLIIILFFSIIFLSTNIKGQYLYIPVDSAASDILSFSFIGSSFQSYGCEGLDPTYWISGSGISVTVTFVNPQNQPSFRVWGMNDDDSASVSVNGVSYPLTSSSASYDDKVICNAIGSPGLEGVLFSGGLLVGANSNALGNYSHQNITLNQTNITSITISGVAGAGWGFAGITVEFALSINSLENEVIEIFPNPVGKIVNIKGLNDDSMIDITVLNLVGQLVYEQRFDHSKNLEIDLSALSAGTYFIQLKRNGSSITKKLIKK